MALLMSDKYSTSEPVHLISRGPLCLRVQEKWSEIRKLAEDEKKFDELTNFVQNLKDSDNYSGGVFHRNTFQVSRKLAIVGIGFFGPHDKDQALYDVSVDFESTKKQATLERLNWYKVPGYKGQIFWVSLQDPFVLEPNQFYNIAFHLEGPKTGILDSKLLQQQIVCYAGDSRVEFSFLRGSLQMPQLKFILV